MVNKKKKKKSNNFFKEVELSQLSEWTNMGPETKKIKNSASTGVISRSLKPVDETKLNSKMDREGLMFELMKYKKFAIQ